MYIRATVKSKMLMRATDMHVFLPFHDGYPDTKAPFPTLYFLPGYSANTEEIATCLPMRQMCAKYGMAIVIVDGENSFYSDHPERATMHGSFVREELVEITRGLFPQLSKKREDTFIGGISMGGYGAAVHGMKANETFSKILMLSPAIDVEQLFEVKLEGEKVFSGSMLDTMLFGKKAFDASFMNPRKAVADLKAAGEKIPKMYMCCGKQDVLVYDACVSFRDYLKEQNVPLTYVEGDGVHMVPYWDEQLEACFEFLKAE